MARKKGIHDTLLGSIADRLKDMGKYDFVMKNVDYEVTNDEGEYVGEVDILAGSLDSRKYRFYEIKSNYSKKSYRTAKNQFNRFRKAHPYLDVKGILITPTKIRRLR